MIVQSPTDTSKTMDFGTNVRETDVTNRASDEGYAPDNYAAVRPTTAYWTGPTLPQVYNQPPNMSSISWAGNQVTLIHTMTPGAIFVGQQFVIANVSPAGYNGTFTALAGTAGNTVVYALHHQSRRRGDSRIDQSGV